MGKIYFQGLDGLRAIAAILVVIGHIELVKKSFNLVNLQDGGGPFYLYLGGHAVTFFFVLSGFLITYLLIKEKENNNSISIKSFYWKRILRIWPVYYLLFVGVFFYYH
jgi:peptidoglycan/LPS O-acetylase OafA/YrhL